MKGKKLLSMLTCMTLVVSLLSGCGGGAADNKKVQEVLPRVQLQEVQLQEVQHQTSLQLKKKKLWTQVLSTLMEHFL